MKNILHFVYHYLIQCLSIHTSDHRVCPLCLIRISTENKGGVKKKFRKFKSVNGRRSHQCINHTYDALNESGYAEIHEECPAICAL